MKHSLPPYTGDESYIFVSYSHRDSEAVLNVIKRMMGEGVRIWYDEGIDPGTEWDENIADHIERCDTVLAFLSAHYLQSENCKDELNFARDLNKDRILVYLEDTKLPAGMAMRLNRLQSIHKYTYQNQEEFYGKLLSAPVIKRNRAIPEKAAPSPADISVPKEPPSTQTPAAEEPTMDQLTEKFSGVFKKVFEGTSRAGEEIKKEYHHTVDAIKNPTPEEREAAKSEVLQDPPPRVPTLRRVPMTPMTPAPPPPPGAFVTGKTPTPLLEIIRTTEGMIRRHGISARYHANGTPDFQKKIENAHSSYAYYSPTETPLMLEDFTVFGSAKQGMVLTDTHLYLNNTFVKRTAIAIDDVRQIDCLPDTFNMFYVQIHTESETFRATANSNRDEIQHCIAFLQEITAYLKRVSAVRSQPTLRNFSAGAWTCLCGTLCKDQFCPNCGRKKQ